MLRSTSLGQKRNSDCRTTEQLNNAINKNPKAIAYSLGTEAEWQQHGAQQNIPIINTSGVPGAPEAKEPWQIASTGTTTQQVGMQLNTLPNVRSCKVKDEIQFVLSYLKQPTHSLLHNAFFWLHRQDVSRNSLRRRQEVAVVVTIVQEQCAEADAKSISKAAPAQVDDAAGKTGLLS